MIFPDINMMVIIILIIVIMIQILFLKHYEKSYKNYYDNNEKFKFLLILEDTPVVLVLDKLCNEHAYIYE